MNNGNLQNTPSPAGETKKVFLNFTKDTLKGIFWAAVSVLCWSSLFVVASFLVRRGNLDPYSMVHLRFTYAGLFILLFCIFVKKIPLFTSVKKMDWVKMILHGIFVAGMSLCLFIAQNRGLPVVNASMLEAETPPVLFLLGVIFLRNKTSFLQIVGLCCGFIGCMIVLEVITLQGFAIRSFSDGDLLIFAAASCWAVYTLSAKGVIERLGGLLYTAWSMFFAGIWTLLYQIVLEHPVRYPVLLPDLFWTLYLILIPSAMAFFSWNNAMKYISTGLLAVSGYFTPMFSALLAAVLFGESITVFQFFGMILVFGSAMIEPEISEGLMGKFKKNNKKDIV